MITSITRLGPPRRDFIYDTVGDLSPRLCVDVGAAAGNTTRRIRELMGPEGRVVAFEPFPGNIPYFRETTSSLTNVTLVQKAVSDAVGTSDFYVDSVVRGSEPGWADRVGYSSVGHLRIGRFERLLTAAKTIRRWVRDPASIFDGRSTHLRVETTTLDAEFPRDVVDFVKVDVQGAEAQVLCGAGRLLRARRIGLLYVEWSGDPEVVDRLEQAGYTVFDSTYVGRLRSGRAEDFEKLGFEVLDKINLSVGHDAFEMTYSGDPARVGEVLRSIRRWQRGWVQTDLIAVSPARLEGFRRSASERLAS